MCVVRRRSSSFVVVIVAVIWVPRYLFAAVMAGIIVTQTLHRSLERAIHERIAAAKGRVLSIPALVRTETRKEGCVSTLFLRCFVPCARRFGKSSVNSSSTVLLHSFRTCVDFNCAFVLLECLLVRMCVEYFNVLACTCAGLIRVRVTSLADDWETAETPRSFYRGSEDADAGSGSD